MFVMYVTELRENALKEAKPKRIVVERSAHERFVRDYTLQALGKAFRDPSGLIWGDLVRENRQKKHFITSSRP